MPIIEAGTEAAQERAKAGGLAKAANARFDPAKQLAHVQRVIMQRIDSDKLTPSELAKLTGALVDSEKLKRIIKGQPAHTSQSIKPIDKQAKRKRITGPIEPME